MNYEGYEPTEREVKLEEYLKSIGGLVNGYFTDRPPITSSAFFSVREGWIPLIQNLIEEAIEAGWDKQICQVKEKFGGLRFYINDTPDKVNDVIRKYESLSYEICEVCGEKGELRKGGWWSTLCDKHHIENEERKKDKNKFDF